MTYDKIFRHILESYKTDLAHEYAAIAHDDEGQRRKGTGERYIVHPEAVADTLERLGANEDVVCAAYLHDTCEDTAVNYEALKDTFGDTVAKLVKEVTNSPDLDGLGKEDYMNEKLMRLTIPALQIKLSDMLNNTMDKPRQGQLERMHNNIVYLQSRRNIDDPICNRLLKRFRKEYLKKRHELENIFM
jgi:(p)ppGpp synthase/HD superfamily hydrolase